MAQKLSFAENFALSGCAAVISKTAAAPIERIKLLIQNQDEMIKQVRLLIFMTHSSAKLYDLKFMTTWSVLLLSSAMVLLALKSKVI